MYIQQTVVISTLFALAHGQALLLTAQGAKNSPASLGLQVQQNDTTDFNFINDQEITDNVVNECGRTALAGNIDIGENTENALAVKQVTQVTKGSKVAVTIQQVNDAGAGPFTCDMDLQGNANGATGQTKLTVKEAAANNGNISLTVTMPADMTCIGASTGDVCTVRCRNAQSFGGCFAVQQTDTTPFQNTVDNIVTAQTLAGIEAQVLQNQKDFQGALTGIQQSGATGAEQGVGVIDGIAAEDAKVVNDAEKLATATGAATATATAAASTGKATGKASGAKASGAKASGAKANGAKNNNNNNNNNRRSAALRWSKRSA